MASAHDESTALVNATGQGYGGIAVVVPSVLDGDHFQLTFLRPDGAVETQVGQSPSAYVSYAKRAIPNGQGGMLVQLNIGSTAGTRSSWGSTGRGP